MLCLSGPSWCLSQPLLGRGSEEPSLSPASLSLTQGDEGGGRVLQQRWTSFLKAQLVCLRPDDGFPFNVLQDVFTLTPRPEDWPDTLFYGVFTPQWWTPRVLAGSGPGEGRVAGSLGTPRLLGLIQPTSSVGTGGPWRALPSVFSP